MEKLEQLINRLEKVTVTLESVADNIMYRTSPIKCTPESKNNASTKEFRELITGPLSEYISCSSKIGDVVTCHADMLRQCFLSQEEIIKLAANCSKPSDAEVSQIIGPFAKKVEDVVKFKDSNRSSKFFNHLSAVAESVAAMGWITVTPAPGPYVKNMQEAGEFFINRVMKEYKDSDPSHIAWSKSLMNLWTALGNYIKTYHLTGLTWNSRGKPATANGFKNSPSSGSDVPPPPPLTAADLQAMSIQDDKGDSAQDALFADLNRGLAVTSHLRKVTDDMKTHKNPQLREGPIVHISPAKPGPKPVLTNRPTTGVLELRGQKWVVENFTNAKNLNVKGTEHKQTVYVYNCNDCAIVINGKINSIMIDNCKKTGLLCDSVISSIDIVNCNSVQVQSLGKLPTVNIDKTDGCQVYLSKESKFADIITSRCSEINVLVPKPNDEFEEFPVPEQFKTNFTGNGLKTVCNSSL